MLRITSTFRSVHGAKFKILVYDRDFTGDETEIDTYAEVLTHEGNPDDPFKRICPTRFSFNMILNSTNYDGPTRTAVVSFYQDLITSYEGRFYITVRQNTLGGIVLFRGKIIADIGDLLLNFYKDVKVTAIDGLTTLKDIEYRPTDYTDLVDEYAIKTYKFNEFFQDILMRSDVNQFFYVDTAFNATGDVLFTTANNWTESKSETGDIWNQVRGRNTWFEQISKSYRRYKKCYEVLENLLTGFNARIIFSNGIYHIEQIGYLDNSTLTRRKYDEAGAGGSSYGNKTTIDITTDADCHILADPSVKQLPAFKAVELRQSKAFTNYINGMDINFPDNPGPHDFGYVIGTGSFLVGQLFINVEIDPTFPGTGPNPFWMVEFKFKVKIGDYYLKTLRPVYDYDIIQNKPGVSNWDPILEYEWTLVDTECIVRWNPYEFPKFETFVSKALIFESLPIVEDGNLIIELTNYRVVDQLGNDVPAETAKLIKFSITKQSKVIVSPSGVGGLTEVPEGLSIYEVGDIRNTLIYQIAFDYFDSDELSFNQLFIQNSIYVTNPEPTTEWTDADMGDTLPIQKLVMKQILGMRTKPTEVINATLQRTDDAIMTYDMRFLSNSVLYMPLKFEHNLYEGTYTVSLYRLFKDYTGIDPIDTGIPDNFDQFPTYTEIGTSASPPLYVTYYEKFKNVTGTTITPSDVVAYYMSDVLTPEDIDLHWTVLSGGVTQEYIDATTLTFPLTGGELQIGEYTIDLENNIFYFGFLDNTTVIFKFIKV